MNEQYKDTVDLIKKHLGCRTPDWAIENAVELLSEFRGKVEFPRTAILDSKKEVYILGYAMGTNDTYVFQYVDTNKIDWAPSYRITEL